MTEYEMRLKCLEMATNLATLSIIEGKALITIDTILKTSNKFANFVLTPVPHRENLIPS